MVASFRRYSAGDAIDLPGFLEVAGPFTTWSRRATEHVQDAWFPSILQWHTLLRAV